MKVDSLIETVLFMHSLLLIRDKSFILDVKNRQTMNPFLTFDLLLAFPSRELTLQCVVDRGIWHIEPKRTVKPAMMSIAKPLKKALVFYSRKIEIHNKFEVKSINKETIKVWEMKSVQK